MRIAVVGSGGLGGYLGGRLAAAGRDVHFVARGAHLEALRRHGLTVQSPTEGFSVRAVRATADAREIGRVDYVLLGVRTWQVASALAGSGPLIGPGTAVLTLQNGVRTPEEVAAVFGRDAVLPGVAKVIAYLDSPGRIHHVGSAGTLTFGEWDNRVTERVERLRDALGDAGLNPVVAEDVWADLWTKFLLVAPPGGLGAVADAPVGALRSHPGTRGLLVDAMTEVHRVAEALGVRLPADVVGTTVALLDRQPPAGISSLHRDIRSGKPSELEAWIGAVVHLGARTATATPVHRFLYEVLSLRAAQTALTTEWP
ncbi:2-dehydropantoate 2-reductase [Kitasatospora sp. NPDC093550]|uniref:2-dehydropantoate 2-reductase n=1 Tax=Kitasatospora sp. NPDC093550 TaxID=3364089 RepID=UPI00382BB597